MDVKPDPDVQIPYNTDIPCRKPARAEEPQCDCWEHPAQEDQRSDKKFDPFVHWLKPEHWAIAMFAGAPTPWKHGACMRVCDKSARIGHISLADGAIGIDLPLLAADPNSPTASPVYVQHGYCCTCDRFEWVHYSKEKLASPIVWFACKKS
jgi:hypothetical protein